MASEMEEVGRADLGMAGRLVLFAPCRDFHPGELVQGVVHLSLNEPPFLLRSVRIKFIGVNRSTKWANKSALNSPSRLYSQEGIYGQGEVDLLENEEGYENGGITEILVGLGEEVHGDESDLLEFHDEHYTWDFSFKVPHNAPLSYCDDYLEVIYSLSTIIDSPMVPSAFCEIVHHVVVGSQRQCDMHLSNDRPSGGGGERESSLLIVPDCEAWSLSSGQYTPADRHQRDNDGDNEDVDGHLLTTRIKSILGYGMVCTRRRENQLRIKLSNKSIGFIDSRHELMVRVEIPTQSAHNRFKVCLSLVVEVDTRPNVHALFAGSNQEWKERRKSRTKMKWLHRYLRSLTSSYEADHEDAYAKTKSSVHRTILWKSEKIVDANDETRGDSSMKNELFVVPTIIDTSARYKTLRAWPRPESLNVQLEAIAHIKTPSIISPLGKVYHKFRCEIIDLTNRTSLFSKKKKGVSPPRRIMESEIEFRVVPPDKSARGDNAECQDCQPSTSAHNSPQKSQNMRQGNNRSGVITKMYDTPHAKEAPIRVIGELIHRGPAAVLVDRGGRVRPSCTTPECFAPLTHISNHNIAYHHSTPSFSPALAHIHDDSLSGRCEYAGQDRTRVDVDEVNDDEMSIATNTPPSAGPNSTFDMGAPDMVGSASVSLVEERGISDASSVRASVGATGEGTYYLRTSFQDNRADESPATTVESPDSLSCTEESPQGDFNSDIPHDESMTSTVPYDEMVSVFRQSTRLMEWLEMKLRQKQLPALQNAHQCVELLSAVGQCTERENIFLWMVRNKLLLYIEDELFGSTGTIGQCFQLQHDVERVSSHVRNEILFRRSN